MSKGATEEATDIFHIFQLFKKNREPMKKGANESATDIFQMFQNFNKTESQ